MATNGYTYCLWPNQFNEDGGCWPNVRDGYHIPCGEEEEDHILDTCPGE